MNGSVYLLIESRRLVSDLAELAGLVGHGRLGCGILASDEV